MAKSSASRSGCHIGVMLKPQPYFSRLVLQARYSPSMIRLGMHSYPSGWKWCSAIQNSS